MGACGSRAKALYYGDRASAPDASRRPRNRRRKPRSVAGATQAESDSSDEAEKKSKRPQDDSRSPRQLRGGTRTAGAHAKHGKRIRKGSARERRTGNHADTEGQEYEFSDVESSEEADYLSHGGESEGGSSYSTQETELKEPAEITNKKPKARSRQNSKRHSTGDNDVSSQSSGLRRPSARWKQIERDRDPSSSYEDSVHENSENKGNDHDESENDDLLTPMRGSTSMSTLSFSMESKPKSGFMSLKSTSINDVNEPRPVTPTTVNPLKLAAHLGIETDGDDEDENDSYQEEHLPYPESYRQINRNASLPPVMPSRPLSAASIANDASSKSSGFELTLDPKKSQIYEISPLTQTTTAQSGKGDKTGIVLRVPPQDEVLDISPLTMTRQKRVFKPPTKKIEKLKKTKREKKRKQHKKGKKRKKRPGRRSEVHDDGCDPSYRAQTHDGVEIQQSSLSIFAKSPRAQQSKRVSLLKKEAMDSSDSNISMFQRSPAPHLLREEDDIDRISSRKTRSRGAVPNGDDSVTPKAHRERSLSRSSRSDGSQTPKRRSFRRIKYQSRQTQDDGGGDDDTRSKGSASQSVESDRSEFVSKMEKIRAQMKKMQELSGSNGSISYDEDDTTKGTEESSDRRKKQSSKKSSHRERKGSKKKSKRSRSPSASSSRRRGSGSKRKSSAHKRSKKEETRRRSKGRDERK